MNNNVSKNESGSFLLSILFTFIIGVCCYFIFFNGKEKIEIQTDKSILVGETVDIKLLYNGDDITFSEDVIWEISNSDVISIENGKISALQSGISIITVSLPTGEIAEVEIEVSLEELQLKGVEIQGDSVLKIGETISLSVVSNPSNASFEIKEWSSSNTSVATVDATGKVTAKAVGKTTITVTTTNGLKASKEITVSSTTVNATKVVINSSSNSLKVGESLTLSATLSPSNTTDKVKNWSSSNTNVATVDATGKVTAKAVGKTTVTVTTTNGLKATKEITVLSDVVAADNVNLNSLFDCVEVGKTLKINATLLPSNTADSVKNWTSSNTNVATVDNNGVVTGVAFGTAVITATTNGGVKESKKITVYNSIKQIKVGTLNAGTFSKGLSTNYSESDILNRASDMASKVKNENVDILGIQEGATSKYGSSGIERFFKNSNFSNYKYLSKINGKSINGNTILISSSVKLVDYQEYLLEKCPYSSEARALQKMVVNIDGVNISFYNTHFSYQKGPTESVFDTTCPGIQGIDAFNYIKNDKNAVIFVGDFNHTDEAFKSLMNSYNFSFYGGAVNKSNDRIDLIFVKEKDSNGVQRISKINNYEVNTKSYTDHNFAISTIKILTGN